MKNPFSSGWFQKGPGKGDLNKEEEKVARRSTGSPSKKKDTFSRSPSSSSSEDEATSSILQVAPPIFGVVSKFPAAAMARLLLGATVALYVLNQKHLLPRPLSAVVSKALFWPTLPITASKRWGKKWFTPIDDTIIVGGAPFGFLGLPERLYEDYGVRGVINFCEEYKGPVEQYKQLGVQHLYLPTTDHFEPSLMDLAVAISFIRAHKAKGDKVYIHCRAGHGRSAAGAFAWLMYTNPKSDLKTLNEQFCQKRNVRKTLWKQENIQELQYRLKRGRGAVNTRRLKASSDDRPLVRDASNSEHDLASSANKEL